MGVSSRAWVFVALSLASSPALAEPTPDADPSTRTKPPTTAPAAPPPEPAGAWKPTAGVVAIAGAVVLAGLTYASHAQVSAIDDAPGFRAYVSTYPSRGDACAAADAGTRSYVPMAVAASVASDACSRRSTYKVLEVVGGITTLTSLGLGIYFLATSPARPDPTRVSLTPRLTASIDPRGSGGMDLVVRF